MSCPGWDGSCVNFPASFRCGAGQFRLPTQLPAQRQSTQMPSEVRSAVGFLSQHCMQVKLAMPIPLERPGPLVVRAAHVPHTGRSVVHLP